MRYLISLSLLGLLAISASAQPPTTGLINVRLPRDARLYVDDVYCPLPGQLRSFETPPLDPGRSYFYTLKVEITVDGKPIRLSKRADVQVGRTTEVDFGDRAAISKAAEVAPVMPPPSAEEEPPKVPQSPPPLPALARVEGAFLVISRPVFEQYQVVEERTLEVDGKPVKEKITVLKIRSKNVSEQIDVRNVKAIELPAVGIASAGLATALTKERSVYICSQDKLDPFYARTLKPGTMILFISAGEPKPIKPVPPPPPPGEKPQ